VKSGFICQRTFSTDTEMAVDHPVQAALQLKTVEVRSGVSALSVIVKVKLEVPWRPDVVAERDLQLLEDEPRDGFVPYTCSDAPVDRGHPGDRHDIERYAPDEHAH
jgi:hypothetical protein